MTRGPGRLKFARSIELRHAALFLDLDGTLAPIAPTPAEVYLADLDRTILGQAAAALEGRLAVISGRTIAELDRIIGREIPCVAGVHGLQRRRADGSVLSPPAHVDLADARLALSDLAAADPRLLLEDKELSVALHYRGAPEAEPMIADVCQRLTAGTGLVLQGGKMVFEVRTPGPDKGDSLLAFMAEPPFIGAVPIFVGDDLTDEAGFEAAVDLGGLGVLVGERPETMALGRLRDPQSVLGWIEASVRDAQFDVGPVA